MADPNDLAAATATRLQLLAAAAAAIDAELPERALVYGSGPPDWRDLDLIVSPTSAKAASGALTRAGYIQRRSTWARFAECSVGVVELLPQERLRLGASDLAALLEEAEPLPGLRRIVVPSPHDALTILASRLASVRKLEPRHRERIARILHDDPKAWERAAASRGNTVQLVRLRHLVEGGKPRPRLAIGRLRRPPRAVAV